MTDSQLYSKLNDLKPSLKREVYDFVDFLLSKQKKNAVSKKPQFGCAKGRFKMASDFDAPLEDLNEYMY
jgi:hypothetical protein